MLATLSEAELVHELDVHDELVRMCARRELTLSQFFEAYASVYPRFPLDGHEFDEAGNELLGRYAARIKLHEEIWLEVETKLTSEEHAGDEAYRARGFIGTEEAVRRIQELARRYLRAAS